MKNVVLKRETKDKNIWHCENEAKIEIVLRTCCTRSHLCAWVVKDS